ncbi:MAG TPA: hypothetical protein VKP30_07975, partial [Polyangiaceae bacterium]|nr:hypothetical protein [Polyangiaceae bacterium]
MTSMANHPLCCLACGYGSNDLVAERGWVHSNVRAFHNEQFEVWRCRNCASLHASEEVEFAHYYSEYPFHKLQSDWRMQVLYD